MKHLISNFTKQLKSALELSNRLQLTDFKTELRNVVICGMGGSGISGNIVAEAVASEIKIPIIVNKDYFLPNYINSKSLVIISSYSGDTEETLLALNEAIEKEAKIVCITSGGKLADIASRKKLDTILIPKGMPPRAAISYGIVQILNILNINYIISSDYKNKINAAIKLLDNEEDNIIKDAKETAYLISGKYPIIYSSAKTESVALRLKQQLNENSKILCSHNVFPELNHNELQGWKEKNKNIAVIILRDKNEYNRTAKRINISSEIIGLYDATIKEIYAKGNSILEKMLYLIHWGDWLSVCLAEIKGIDTLDISVITYLKSELAKIEEQ
jgi:glucose/mannose-6-phosphate isomerase